jgi:branched-chain amino acid transport system permease protein
MKNEGWPRRGAGAAALFIICLVLLPLSSRWLGNDYAVTTATRMLILALAASSLNLILGYGGMVSLGHAAFLGIGGYTFAALATNGITSGYLQWPAAVALSALAAAVVGTLSLRTRGVYFIMVTLAFAQMFYYLSVGLDVLGGDDGLTIDARSDFGKRLPFVNRTVFYFVCLILLLMAMAFLARLVQSQFGYVLRGAAMNERRMRALGFRVERYQLAAFVFAGGLCGLAGVLLANLNDFISPSFMAWGRSADLVIIVVLGGMGSVMGPLYGAFVYILAEEALSSLTTYWQLIFGPLILIFVRFFGTGLAGLIDGRRDD